MVRGSGVDRRAALLEFSVAVLTDDFTIRIGHGQPADAAGSCAEPCGACPVSAIPAATAQKGVRTSHFPGRSQWRRQNISFQLRGSPLLLQSNTPLTLFLPVEVWQGSPDTDVDDHQFLTAFSLVA